MSARNSLQIDERRPLAMIDTETTDYYDDIGGIPPPHRLSGLYNQGGHSPSSSGFNLANMMNTGGHHSSSHGSAEDSIRSPSYATQGLNNYQPSTRELQQQQQNQNPNFQEFPMSTSFTSNRLYQNNYSDSRTGLTTSDSFTNEKNAYSMHDDSIHAGDNVAFLGGGNMVERGGMSPAVAARERYMARKEAQGNQYAYGAGAGAGGLGGAEMGNLAGAGGSSRGCFAGKRKWIWIVGIGAIVIAAIVGIAVGVSNHKSSGSNSSLTAVSGDPSSFTPTAGLYRSFYGMDYTPLNSQYPACGDTLEDVIQDVQLMSQLTPRFRVYGSDCNVATFSLAAINQTQVNMTVFLAAWVPQPTADDADATWTRQKNQVISAIQTYGSDHVEGVTVGNEYLLNGGTVSDLLDKVTEMRTALAALNLPKTIAVGTADAGSMITSTLAEGCDFVGANVHPWFGGVPVDQAAGWVYEYTSTNTPASALQASNKPKLYIAETGWPTNANDTASLTYEGAQAGVPELNTFLESYICQANQNITAGGEYSNYFFFEMFDEPWKAIYGGVEEYWGLFNANKTLKNGLVIPNCPIS